ncbi:MAG: hypothetical protein AAF222_11950 [Pseudomonadota bacterium]
MAEKISKRELAAARKARAERLTSEIKSVVKGSGWTGKLAYQLAYRNNNGMFAAVEYSQRDPDLNSGLKFQCRVKPMDIDPLLWQILHIDGNERQPLSFRSVGAFTATPLQVECVEVLESDLSVAAAGFREFLDRCSVFNPSALPDFADRVAAIRKQDRRALFELHVVSLILEGRFPEAGVLAEEGLVERWSSKHAYYAEDAAKGNYKTRPFAEMALRWIGETTAKR